MKFFLDTANVEYIKEVNEMGVISGVTTNPSLVAKEGRDFNEVIKEITEIVDGPISGEVVSEDAEGMIKEGREIAKIHKNMIVKITDPELLEKTGGIVQGMSGSPIIQNGMLVGAVTHVFVNEPEKGYGIFAENMLENSYELVNSQKLAS